MRPSNPRRGGARRVPGRPQDAAFKPDGTVRQSQAVTTYGPGSTLDLVDHAVLVGGLDFWDWGKGPGRPVEKFSIFEPRLRDSLAPRFLAQGRRLSETCAFMTPPAGDDRAARKSVGVQVLEFPAWFVCQNPRCRALVRRDALAQPKAGGRYYHQCDRETRTLCVPVRFLGACRLGHIDEWPWILFVHLQQAEETRCLNPQLRLDEDASGDFNAIVVSCTTCRMRAPMSGAYAPGLTIDCRGDRPWLPRDQERSCDEGLRLLVRTASNSYFSQVVSALSVPDPSAVLDEKVAECWAILIAASRETLGALRQIPSIRAALAGFSDEEVLAAVDRKRAGGTGPVEPLRTTEFRQFIASEDETPGELPPENAVFFARKVEPLEPLAPGFDQLVLAAKLREVRAQIGFTRIEPVTPDLQGEFDLGVRSAPLGLMTDWLPASEIRGEGVFVRLDEEAVRAWESRPAVVARGKELLAGYDDWVESLLKGLTPDERAARRKSLVPFPGTRFYLLHSLSHLLLSAISLECGYAASAIRERIYCAPANAPLPMAAILLSTGTSGTEGTLGGLVEQGRALQEHLRHAYDLGALCSNDPVCSAHSPRNDYAERWLEGAACHGCLFVAECSCEWFNRYLDRALVVPTIGQDPDLAYLRARP
jgi:hypothetical protein